MAEQKKKAYNDDGTPRTASNNSEANIPRQGRPRRQRDQIEGDNADLVLQQFDPCKYNNTKCKHIDNRGNCCYENCIFDKEETPVMMEQFWTHCIICDNEFSINPRNMKAYICDSCRERLFKAEKLPFTCIFCGRQQEKPARVIFSQTCDECFDYVVDNRGCRKYEKGGGHGPF